jgi:effector-binding domain-containing protein
MSQAFTEPVVCESFSQQTVVIRASGLPLNELRNAFDWGYPAIAQLIGEQQLGFAGPAFSRYDTMPGDTVDLELGFPVENGLTESVTFDGQTIVPSSLPSGRVVKLSHLGSYDTLGDSWSGLMAWVQEQGHQPAMPIWEVYVTEPSPDSDPAQLRTDLFVLLQD